jgi:hypothetical protein
MVIQVRKQHGKHSLTGTVAPQRAGYAFPVGSCAHVGCHLGIIEGPKVLPDYGAKVQLFQVLARRLSVSLRPHACTHREALVYLCKGARQHIIVYPCQVAAASRGRKSYQRPNPAAGRRIEASCNAPFSIGERHAKAGRLE